jgi:hypothetical protein
MPVVGSAANSDAVARALRNRLSGKVAARSRATAAGVRRSGAGSRVSTENVSKAACPARPSVRPASASTVASWSAWSATASATATLVSTRSGVRCLAPAGIAERTHEAVVDRRAGGRDREAPVARFEGLRRERLDPQRGALGHDLDGSGAQAELVAQDLGMTNRPALSMVASMPRSDHQLMWPSFC